MAGVWIRLKSQSGFMLITIYMMIPLLLVMVGAIVAYAFSDLHAAQRSQADMQALYMAEAGIDDALVQLRDSYSWTGGSGVGAGGEYSVTVEDLGSSRLRVMATGMADKLLAAAVSHAVEIIVEQAIPPNFYDNAVWASQNLDFKGNAYSVAGAVRHGDTTPSSTGNVNGSVTYDPDTNPLPRLDFEQIYEIAQAQGNVYDAARIGNGHNVFPTSFWYQQPTDPTDPTTGVPNVNYITTDLVLNGNIGTIGGFFVVVGDVITDPFAVEDTTINGNGQVAGAIYSRGDFRVTGGGNGLNVNGSVWAGDETRLNGKVTMTYNWDYMHAIEGLGINPDVTVISWQDGGSVQEDE